MIEKIHLNNILFLDIETVPEEENFNALDSDMKALWEQKTQYQRRDARWVVSTFEELLTVEQGHVNAVGNTVASTM